MRTDTNANEPVSDEVEGHGISWNANEPVADGDVEELDLPDLDVTAESGEAIKGGIPKSDNGDC